MDESRQTILSRAIYAYGEESQVDMCIEEMSELAKALLKMRRVANTGCVTLFPEKTEAVREEIADVQIMLDQMRLIFGDTETHEITKLARLERKLNTRQNI